MASDDEEVDSGWGEAAGEGATPAPSASEPTPAFGMPAVRRPLGSTPAFGMLASPSKPPGARTPPFGTPVGEATSRARKKTPVGGLEAPRGLPEAATAPPIAAPRAADARSLDRDTMPPPMPEQEYIEHVLSMDDRDIPPPRRRMNTLVEHDPLQYDAPAADENTRPTKPPEPAPPTARPGGHDDPSGGGDEFLDLELDLGDGAIAPAAALTPPPPAPPTATPRRAMFPARGPAPATDPPPTVRADALDDLPIEEVLESIPPRAYSMRPAAGGAGAAGGAASVPTASPPLARAAVPESSKIRPSPATLRHPTNPGPSSAGSAGAARVPPKPYDSSPAIEVVHERDADDLEQPPPRIPSPRPRASARPPAKTPAAGTPIVPEARRTPLPASEPPTREVRREVRSAESPLDRIIERVAAGDFGRALMLAEQTIAGGDTSEDLQHYAELCREKLRQTYLERIGSGRTILRVAEDPDALRRRALDPRLAFLLSLLDGASTIDDVIDMSTMPPLEAVRALHELLQEGVVEVAQPGRRRQVP